MTLREGDSIVGAAAIPKNYGEHGKSIITITQNGYGKRCEIAEYTAQHRGGKGLICHRVNEKTGALAGIAVVSETDDIMLITDGGVIIRTRVAEIPVYGRSAGGVIVMRPGEGSMIARFAVVPAEEEQEEPAASEEAQTDTEEQL